nr:hypothetical protein [Bacteroidota bacterium]
MDGTDQISRDKKVLIIDDDQFSVLLTKLKLKKYINDENITSCNGVNVAIEFLEAQISEKTAMIPDLILLETMIDDTQGWEFITYFDEIVERSEKLIKLVILTSSQFFSDYRRSSQMENVSGYLIKPLQTQLLPDIFSMSENRKVVDENILFNSIIV